jgi:hypothetical protein
MKNPKDSKKAILKPQWTVTLHPLAERELQTIPADMQARFLHIGEMLEELGPQRVGLPHIRPLESKLWEIRMTGRDGRDFCGPGAWKGCIWLSFVNIDSQH